MFCGSATGNIVRDLEVKKTHKDKSYVKGTIAFNRITGPKETCFLDFVAWGKTAEIMAEWYGKGSRVTLHGYMEQNRWEDDSGGMRSRWELTVQWQESAAKKADQPSKGEAQQSTAGWDSPSKHQEGFGDGGHPTDDMPF